jgi:3-mercaptopyruvate sulfurtransferase SseA
VRSAREAPAPAGGPDLIPGSLRLAWESFMSCGAVARFPDEERLRRVFRPAAPYPDRPLLVVGGEPGEAAFGWFAARLLGYPAHVSEETFEEWSSGVHPLEWSDPERHGLSPPPRR